MGKPPKLSEIIVPRPKLCLPPDQIHRYHNVHHAGRRASPRPPPRQLPRPPLHLTSPSNVLPPCPASPSVTLVTVPSALLFTMPAAGLLHRPPRPPAADATCRRCGPVPFRHACARSAMPVPVPGLARPVLIELLHVAGPARPPTIRGWLLHAVHGRHLHAQLQCPTAPPRTPQPPRS
jgi:hypothetical protein